MFRLAYFYYYMVAWLLLVCLTRVQKRKGEMKGVWPSIVAVLCTMSLVVFLVLGFWFMPKWWYPLVFFGLSILTGFVPIPDKAGAWLAVFAAPVLCVMAYLFISDIGL